MNQQDRRFMDVFMVVLGILVGIALGLFALARMMGTVQDDWRSAELMVLERVDERIAPIGQVITDPDAVAAQTPVAQAQPQQAGLTGTQVYNQACLACHATGVGGAPITGEPTEWDDRMAQGMDTLYQHSIEGFQGPAGFMPPKGGRLDLSDEEVRAAVDYMVEQLP